LLSSVKINFAVDFSAFDFQSGSYFFFFLFNSRAFGILKTVFYFYISDGNQLEQSYKPLRSFDCSFYFRKIFMIHFAKPSLINQLPTCAQIRWQTSNQLIQQIWNQDLFNYLIDQNFYFTHSTTPILFVLSQLQLDGIQNSIRNFYA